VALAHSVFFDTSILVSAFIAADEVPSPAEAALDAIAQQRVTRPLTSWHCVLEFYSVATRLPGGLRLDPLVAGQIVSDVLLKRFEVCDLPAEARLAFVESAVGDRVAGGRVYDARSAASASAAGARALLTFNRRHFEPSPPGLEIVEPPEPR